jgi:PAS domain-containing protein
MNAQRYTDWTIWLRQQRRIVINFLTRFILILGLAGLMISLERVIRERTVTFNSVYYTLSYILVLLLFVVRKIPDTWRAFGFVALIYAFGSLAFYSGWLAGGGRAFLLTMIVVASILINPRAGLHAAGLAFLTYVLFGIAFNQGWLKLGELPDPTTVTSVIFEGIGYAINIVMVTGGLWYFGRALMAADQANREAQEARTLLAAQTRELEQANRTIARQSQEALAYSEVKFRNIVQQAIDAIVLCDEQGMITEWNQAAEQITGMRQEEAIGHPYWAIQFCILPEDRRQNTSIEELRGTMSEAL